MPYIPLLKPNLELAMPQVPALDHVPRPQIDVRGVLASMQALGDASQRGPIDERPFVEAAGAKGKAMGEGLNAVGSVLMDASRVFGVLAQKRQEAHEDRQIQQFHAEMRQENERRLAYQAKTPDTSKWRADAMRGAQRVAKPYENVLGVSAGVQQHLKGTAATFKTVTDIDTQARVDKAAFADTARAYAKNIDATIQFGDYDTSDGLIEEGGKRGYFSQEQVQGMLAQTAQRRREDQLMTVVQEHPQEAPEWFAQEDKLTEYKLTPWERREWEHRAQSFWEDHERQSVGQVLDGMHNGEITAVKQLEHWKPDMGPKAYADLSEMLTARKPAGVPKNDPAMKEQTIATIANVKLRPGEVDSQIAAAKLGEDIKNSFTGGNREELLGRLEARVKSPDAGRESMLGVALRNLNEWAFGHPVRGVNPKGPLADESPVPTASIASTRASYPSVAERVKSIREDVEEAIKTGKIKTREDATDFLTKRVIAANRELPRVGAAARLTSAGQGGRPGGDGVPPVSSRDNIYVARDGTVYDSRTFLAQNGPVSPGSAQPSDVLKRAQDYSWEVSKRIPNTLVFYDGRKDDGIRYELAPDGKTKIPSAHGDGLVSAASWYTDNVSGSSKLDVGLQNSDKKFLVTVQTLADRIKATKPDRILLIDHSTWNPVVMANGKTRPEGPIQEFRDAPLTAESAAWSAIVNALPAEKTVTVCLVGCEAGGTSGPNLKYLKSLHDAAKAKGKNVIIYAYGQTMYASKYGMSATADLAPRPGQTIPRPDAYISNGGSEFRYPEK